MDTHETPLSASARTLLSEFCVCTDLAEHLRAIPEAAQLLGLSPDTQRGAVLAGVEQRLAVTQTELETLGLYPGPTTTAVELVVNGVPIDLPALCREQCIHPLSDDADSPTKEVPMEAVPERSTHTPLNSQDLPVATDTEQPGFVNTHVRPYAGHAAAFLVGAFCAALGVSCLGSDDPTDA